MCNFLRCHFVLKQRKELICLQSVCNVNFTNGTALKSVQVNSFLLQCYFTVRRMQSNFCRYHFGLEWEKRKIVCRVHAKRILQTAPHNERHLTASYYDPAQFADARCTCIAWECSAQPENAVNIL